MQQSCQLFLDWTKNCHEAETQISFKMSAPSTFAQVENLDCFAHFFF